MSPDQPDSAGARTNADQPMAHAGDRGEQRRLPVVRPGPASAKRASIGATAAGLRDWICSGACQSGAGAFVAWVDAGTGDFSYIYPEITGYALTYLAKRAELDRELEVGHRAARWLTDRVRVWRLAARDGWDNEAVYLFDLGMIATGLVAFGRRTGRESYIRAGEKLARFIERAVMAETISAVWPWGPPSYRANWSTKGSAHLAKLVQVLLVSGRIEAAARLIECTKAAQRIDGSFPTDRSDPTTMLHPHLYAAEGLWIWGTAQGDSDALERGRAAVDWAWMHQLDEGGFPTSVTSCLRNGSLEQLDVTFQAVRLALAYGERSEAVELAVARLVQTARECGGKLALPYRPTSGELHLNTWATMFGTQALELAQAGTPPLAWQELV